jgi:hypothetical protein
MEYKKMGLKPQRTSNVVALLQQMQRHVTVTQCHSNFTLSGSSYILADATRGLGVNTFNMKKNDILLR